jgi:copper oxidase (laccase) domain-containing protein
MIREPFALLRPFSNRLAVALWTKADPRPHDVCGVLQAQEEASAEQVHGNVTTVVREAVEYIEGADGLATDRIGLALSVRTADCQSFVVYAPDRNVAGVLHVGWRGLIAGAIPRFFQTLKEEWDIDPKETFVAAGPSLCEHCADFTDPTRTLPTLDAKFMNGKYVDLRGAAEEQLFTLGVRRDRFERHPDCTRCRPELYWTYRGGDREAVKSGETNLLGCVLL